MTKPAETAPETQEAAETETMDDRAMTIARETLTGDIRDIILNKRKIELIERMQEDIYANAQKKNVFEIY